jgi:hypothetical protein
VLSIPSHRDKEEDRRRKKVQGVRRWEVCTPQPILPKDDNYKLCNPVEDMGVKYSYQCVFCNDLFIRYPSRHMESCARFDRTKDRDPTTAQKNLEIYKRNVEDYGTRVCDTSNDWKVRMLPIDASYGLCRPVYYEGEVYHYQCWFCGKLCKSFEPMVRFHMGVCSESQYAPAVMLGEFISLFWYLKQGGLRRYTISYHGDFLED